MIDSTALSSSSSSASSAAHDADDDADDEEDDKAVKSIYCTDNARSFVKAN